MEPGPIPPAVVTVRPLTPNEFESWREQSIESYAADIATATKRPIESALGRAREQFAELLPAGLASEHTWVLRVLDSVGTEVGMLWLGPVPGRADAAYVFDLAIEPTHRRRGLGRATMRMAELIVRDAGFTELGLKVFGFNEPARRLYDSLGYRVVATQMAKTIG